jgi:hypothetical protein
LPSGLPSPAMSLLGQLPGQHLVSGGGQCSRRQPRTSDEHCLHCLHCLQPAKAAVYCLLSTCEHCLHPATLSTEQCLQPATAAVAISTRQLSFPPRRTTHCTALNCTLCSAQHRTTQLPLSSPHAPAMERSQAFPSIYQPARGPRVSSYGRQSVSCALWPSRDRCLISLRCSTPSECGQ